jgi:polyferredoxin
LHRSLVLRRVLRPRVLIYTAVLVLICGALLTSLLMRTPFKVDVVRDRGTLARVVDDGWVENVYRLQVMNATEQVQRYRIRVSGLPEMTTDLGADIVVDPAEARWVPVAVRVPPQAAAMAGAGSHGIQFTVDLIEDPPADVPRSVAEKSTFMVPR